MKVKKLFLSALAAVTLLASCSKDGPDEPVTPVDLTGKAYLSLSLKNNNEAMARSNTSQPGTEAESKAEKVTVLLFDETFLCLGAADFSGLTVGNSAGNTPTAEKSDAKLVPAATKKIFVVINPVSSNGWDLTNDAVKGKSWQDINTTIKDASLTIGSLTATNSFMMTSAGNQTYGALTTVEVVKPASDSQNDIDAAKNAAKDKAAEVYVNRMSAKVTVSENSNGVTTGNNNADKFTFVGWELNITNKSIGLYTDIVAYENASSGAVQGIYRKDANYLLADQPVQAKIGDEFNCLTNGGNDPASNMSAVARAKETSAYCFENTMDAPAQKLGYTTKAVVKAKYTPAGISEGTSYFFWHGSYLTLTDLKALYLTHGDGTGLKTDLPIFLKKAGLMASSVTDQSDINDAVAALTDNDFDAVTGVKGRYCAVRYYHESVCYYDVLIRHDQNVTADMALGRYGVVRNNWYGLTINSAGSPGTPWIPDPTDPEDPTKPDTDDDDNSEAYLSVSITVNPWTFWNQGVDLN